MKILNITSIALWPLSTGGARHALTSAFELSKKNEVIILTTKNSSGVENYYPNLKIIKELDVNPILKFSPISLFKISKICKEIKPDLLIIDFPWFGIYGWIINLLLNIPFDIREHNVEFIRFKRLGKWWWKILKYYEGFVYQTCNKIRYISILDKNIIKETYNIKDKKFIDSPYIADPNVFYPNPKARTLIRKQLKLENKFIVMFFGPLDYQPNQEALEIISKEIAPKFNENNKIIFLIVGRNPPKLKNKNIIFTGFVEKIEDYINASDLIIVPLKSGGGVRTKIIESLACGKIILTTKIGNEGIFVNSKTIVSNLNHFYKQIKKIIKKQ